MDSKKNCLQQMVDIFNLFKFSEFSAKSTIELCVDSPMTTKLVLNRREKKK